MTKPKNKIAPLLKRRKSIEGDFSFFRVLDNTVLGAASFIVDFYFITVALLFCPSRAEVLIRSRSTRSVGPFVYLLCCSLPVTLVIKSDERSFSLRERFFTRLSEFSWDSVLAIAVPLTVASVLLLAILTMSFKPPSGARRLFHLAAYTGGAQLLVVSAGTLLDSDGGFRLRPLLFDFPEYAIHHASLIIAYALALLLPAFILKRALYRQTNAGRFRGFRVAFLGFSMMCTVPVIASKVLELASFSTKENRLMASDEGWPTCTILDSRDIAGDRFLFVEVFNRTKHIPMLIHKPTGATTYLQNKDGKVSSEIQTGEGGDSLYTIINPGEMKSMRIRIPGEIVANADRTSIVPLQGRYASCTEPPDGRWQYEP